MIVTMLGDLEIEHLAIMRRLRKANGRQVLAELNKKKDLAYTTVSTTLERLYKKGYLEEKFNQKEEEKTMFMCLRTQKRNLQKAYLTNLFTYLAKML